MHYFYGMTRFWVQEHSQPIAIRFAGPIRKDGRQALIWLTPEADEILFSANELTITDDIGFEIRSTDFIALVAEYPRATPEMMLERFGTTDLTKL